MKNLKSLSIVTAFLGSLNLASAATVFQIDFQSASPVSGQVTQSGWTAWNALKSTGGASINSATAGITGIGGIDVTITALGTSGKIEARGGAGSGGDDRSTTISGTSWNDMVEDLIVARNGTGTGAGDMTIALTGLTAGLTYTLTGWHNDSYTLNEGFSANLGYLITPSITTGTLVGVADAGASTNVRQTTPGINDSLFNTSVISFTSDGIGNATILLTGDSTSNFLALNGLQLDVVPEPSVALLGGVGLLGLLRRRRA